MSWGPKANLSATAPPAETAVSSSLGSTRARVSGLKLGRKTKEMDVLVTHGSGRIGYNIVRSLGRKGLSVALGTDEFLGMAVLSRYTSARFRHPSFVHHPEEFILSLREALCRFGPRVYIPAEQENLVVARFLDRLNNLGIKIPIAPFATLRVLHKKDALVRLAKSVDVPVPETIVPSSLAEVRAFAREVGDPVVFKRLNSSSGRGVFYTTFRELESAENSAVVLGLPIGEFLMQKYVGGAGYGVSMLFHHGELRAKFTHKRLREREMSGGVSTLRLSVKNSLLEEYAERILSCARFHGVAMVEFKYDEETKQGWVLEVNPRFWGSLALAIHAGVDFPYLLYRMALDGDVDPVFNYRTNVLGRWILGDTFTLLRRFGRNGHGGSPALPKPVAHVYDDFDWGDPQPFAGQLAFSACKYLRTLHYRPEDCEICPDRL